MLYVCYLYKKRTSNSVCCWFCQIGQTVEYKLQLDYLGLWKLRWVFLYYFLTFYSLIPLLILLFSWLIVSENIHLFQPERWISDIIWKLIPIFLYRGWQKEIFSSCIHSFFKPLGSSKTSWKHTDILSPYRGVMAKVLAKTFLFKHPTDTEQH